MIAVQKILVATDFSKPSTAALEYGRELARSFGAALTVLHIVDDVMARDYGIDGGVLLADPGMQQQLDADALAQVDRLITADDRRQLKACASVISSTAPAAAIVTCAHTSNVDLIVMGTHGRGGGFAHPLTGSVAECVARRAPCPVLTVRQPEHEFVLPDAMAAVTRA
jgi:nucleotide-binding universal stress UspA family protein